jgi:hypothetical protein
MRNPTRPVIDAVPVTGDAVPSPGAQSLGRMFRSKSSRPTTSSSVSMPRGATVHDAEAGERETRSEAEERSDCTGVVEVAAVSDRACFAAVAEGEPDCDVEPVGFAPQRLPVERARTCLGAGAIAGVTDVTRGG